MICFFTVLLLYRNITAIGRLSKILWFGVMGTIGWIIFAGLTHFNAARAFDFPPGAFTLSHHFLTGLGGAMLIATYDYWGYYNVSFLGDEIKDPEKNIPRALLLSILLVACLYLMMNLCVLAVVPWREMMHGGTKQHRPVCGVVVHAAGVWRVGGAAGDGAGDRDRVRVGLFAMLGYSRVPYAAAKDGNYFKYSPKSIPSQIPARVADGAGSGGGGLLFFAVEGCDRSAGGDPADSSVSGAGGWGDRIEDHAAGDAAAVSDVALSVTGVSIPLPTGAQVAKTGGGTYIGMYTTPTDSDEYLGKYDENIGNKDHVTATYFFIKTASTPSGGGNINWTGNQSPANQTNLNLADVHTFSGTTANQAWLTFTRAMGGRALIPVTGPANQTLASFGSNFLIQGPAGLPYLNGAGFSTGNPNAGPVTGSDNYELRDIVSMTKGKHNLSLGGEFALDKTMFAANLNNYGDVSFSTSAPTSTGVAIADFITGQINSFEQDSTYITHLSTWHYAAFAQDNYRITPRFTANLGLRWDIDTPPVDAHNRTASFVPGQQSTVTPAAPLGQLFPGDKGIGRGIISTPFSHISPRLGFAWDPFGDGKTSIRAAAGIFYGSVSGNEWNQPGNAMPFSIRNGFGSETSITNIYNVGFPSTAPGGGIFPYTFTPSAPKFYPSQGIEAIPTNFKDSSVYQFNLSVQRQLPYRISMTAAYVGTLGRHLSSFVDANYAPYSTVNSSGGALVGALSTSAASTEQRRQYDAGINLTPGTLGGITYLISDQTSNYNGLQVSATKSMSKGFSVSGFYVWSRALESSNPVENGAMNAQDFGVLGKPFTPSNNSMGAIGGGLGEEYGPMDQNHDSNAAISGMWNIDYFHGSNRILKGVVNGWQISPVVYLISGVPFTVSTGSNKNFDSAGQSRPNSVPGVSPKLDPHRCRVCAGDSVLTGMVQQRSVRGQRASVARPNGPGSGASDLAAQTATWDATP